MHFYKTIDEKGIVSSKNEILDENLISISEEEFNALCSKTIVSSLPQEERERRAREKRIRELKGFLNATDYQAIKFSEGVLSMEEYASMKAQRQEWRREINELEGEE